MATSAPLSATQRLMDYSARLRVQPANRRGSPIYSASPFTPCRRPYSGGSSDCIRRFLHRWCCLRQIRIGSAATGPTNPEQVGRVTKLQRSLNATAWRCCLPCSGQDFYYRACVGRVAPKSHVGYDWMAHRLITIAGLSPAGLAALWAANGLNTDSQKSLSLFSKAIRHLSLSVFNPCSIRGSEIFAACGNFAR